MVIEKKINAIKENAEKEAGTLLIGFCQYFFKSYIGLKT
jgi:hypothetical protein